MRLIKEYTSEKIPYSDSLPHAGELRLLSEIIMRAIRDLGKTGAEGNASGYWTRDAFDWLFLEHKDDPAPFSFEWCCNALEVDCASIRKGIIALIHHT